MGKKKRTFKWLGSLANLSSSRDKTARSRDGSVCEAKAAAAVESRTVDDTKPCLKSPGYARSGDMYSHVGTVPRSESFRKSFRELKERKKSEREEQEGTSKPKEGGHVRESPLLSALSTLSLTSMEPLPVSGRPLPTAPTPVPAAPLTSAPDSPPRDLSHVELSSHEAPGKKPKREFLNASKAASKQDVYVPMDPIFGAGHGHQTERRAAACAQEADITAGSSQEVRTADRSLCVTDSSGEYVKFSKEKFWLEPPSENLRKQLEEELKLSGTNLKSHAWYHGRIPWEVSESLVVNHGDFLVRDSQSSQGDFVLTSHWEQKTLHFLIRKTAVPSGETYTRVQYSLEGEAFDSLPALVHFYVGSRAALTQWSGAQIHQPVNRTLPLSYLETAFCPAVSPKSCQRAPRNGSRGDETVCPRSPSSLHHKGAEVLSAGESSHSTPCSHTPQSRGPCGGRAASGTPSPIISRCSDAARSLPPPSSTQHKQHLDGPQPPRDLHTDGSCYTELHPGPQGYVERLHADKGCPSTEPLRSGDGNVYFSPLVETVSCFKPSRYRSQLMPTENKPLEVSFLRRMKELLAEVEPRTAARHITRADCMVARILDVTPEMRRLMGVSSGMELLTLPHGQQLRLDLLERFHSMAIMFAVNVLGCTGTNEERAALLYKIIQIAAELKSTLGNMFGFAAVMKALELPQVSRLEETWMALRQRHTEGAILYEKTLRPFMKSLNDGRESCPLSSTTFPHVLPLLSLLEKSVALGEGTEPWEAMEVGMDVVMFHLGAARTIAQLGGIYCSNAESKLQGFQEQPEIRELFLTDFQLRLLWGSRGAEENQAARYSKFDQVLTALSNRLQPPGKN